MLHPRTIKSPELKSSVGVQPGWKLLFSNILLLKVCSSITWLPRRKAGSQTQPHNYRIRICILRSSPGDLAEQETEKHCLGIDGNLQTDQSFSTLTSKSPVGFVSVKIPGSFPRGSLYKAGMGPRCFKKFTCLPLLVKISQCWLTSWFSFYVFQRRGQKYIRTKCISVCTTQSLKELATMDRRGVGHILSCLTELRWL